MEGCFRVVSDLSCVPLKAVSDGRSYTVVVNKEDADCPKVAANRLPLHCTKKWITLYINCYKMLEEDPVSHTWQALLSPHHVAEDQGLGFAAVHHTAGGNDLPLRDVTENIVHSSNLQ